LTLIDQVLIYITLYSGFTFEKQLLTECWHSYSISPLVVFLSLSVFAFCNFAVLWTTLSVIKWHDRLMIDYKQKKNKLLKI